MERSETWRTEALKSFAISKSGMQGGEAKINLTWSILDDSHVRHFWSTCWSPIYACYMLFRSSGSQQSNGSNGVRFWVEMKDLQPLQADHSKLKEEFCTALWNHPFVARWFRSLFIQCCGFPPEVSRHNGSQIQQAERPLRSIAKSAFCCENFAAILHSARVFSWSFPIFVTEILRFFALDIWCLNPKILLVSHQL